MRNAILRVFTILFTFIFAWTPAFAEDVRSQNDVGVVRQKQGAAAPTSIDPVKDGPDGADGAGKGLDSVYSDILKSYNEVRGMWGVIVNDKAAPKITEYKENYQNNRTSCIDRQKYAAYACLENWSPAIQDGVAAVNTLMSTVGSAAVKDSCSNFAKAMDIAKYAMTAYTGACGTMKAGCGMSCVSARNSLEDLYKLLYGNTVITCVNTTTCAADRTRYNDARSRLAQIIKQELDKGNNLSIAGKAEVCTGKYAQLAISAAAGIYGIAQSLKQGESCEEASNADGATAGTTTTAEKCAVESNANLPECICLKNPMLEGCGSTAAKASMNASEGGLSALSSGSSEAGKDGLNASDLAVGGAEQGIDGGARSPSSSAGGVGAPVGGGGANLSGGSGFGGGAASGDEKSGQKPLDTNILAGSGGGGGGGGMWGGGGDSDSDKSGYRSYLPGGAKDPLKMNGGATNASKEVTGQGGKSNWEKVRERYQDNRSSLLNN
ncbi:hypothetical protein [Bdellovibrio sp. HCB274]|uniref:hypothetical protein n=1 Tax=Bdellovibrio sp. HCB274 TaxID=3394361 RepID=UPI0039B69F4D